MGTDIHMHAEIKIGEFWEHYSILEIGRDYDLFSKLAGVRGNDYDIAIAPDRGLPDDVSMVTAISRKTWGKDAHSCSYITSEEFMELFKRVSNKHHFYKNFLFGNLYMDFFSEAGIFPEELEDFRFVFWFDS